MNRAPTPEQLLADAAWLKRLAVTLAGNEADADDLVQESWIAAWSREPDSERPLRPWLAKVVRDLAGMKRRSARRRATREEAVVDRDAVASPPDALLDQMRLHRLLVDLVLELDEPYRSTIIARFVEGRTAASIARSLRIPESTVRGRLRDGLARLRAQLDAARGERKAWAPAVLAFVNGGIQVAKPTKAIFLLVALLLLLVGGGAVVVLTHGAGDSQTVTDTPTGSRSLALAQTPRAVAEPAGPAAAWLAAMGDVARAVAGRVVDERGEPIAGATVELQGWAAALGSGPEARVTTGSDGAFRFQPRSPWSYVVVASAAGRTPAATSIDVRQAKPAELVLVLAACTATAEGAVTDSGGGPIAGARVQDLRAASGLLGPFGPSTTTAPDGHYSLCLSPGEHRVMFGADGYEHVLRVLVGQGRQRVDVELAIAATVTGRVIDESGTPLPDVQINLVPWTWESGGPAPRSILTDRDGRFEIRNVGAGRFVVSAWDPAHIVQGRQSVTVEAGREADILLRLVRAVDVSGTVRLNGKPLPGASIAVAFPSVPVMSKTFDYVTRDDGTFTVHAAAVHAQARLEVEGYDVLSPRVVDTTRGPVANLVVDVAESPKLRGQVVHQGLPVADAEVQIRSALVQTAVRADASGQFAAALQPGTYTLLASSDALGAFSATSVTVTTPTTRAVTIELDGDARIFGKVIDKAGAPVVGVEVSASREPGADFGKGTAGVDGAFVLDQLAGNGAYKLTVRPFPGARPLPWAGAAPAPIVMTDSHAHAGPLQLVVDRARGEIAGSVVDDTDAPVADAIVRLAPWAGLPVAGPAWPIVRTDVDGRFRLNTSGPGPFTIEASLGNGPQATQQDVAAGTRDLQIRLVRTGEVHGTLVGLARARVWLQRSGVLSTAASYVARVEGEHFRATNLLPGVYTVAALSDANPGATATVTVKSGAVTSVTLAASDSRPLAGRIAYVGSNAPVAGATCVAAAASGIAFPPAIAEMARAGVRTATSDATGAFRIPDAPTGDVVIFCTQTPEHTSGSLLVTAGEPAVVQVARRSETRGDVGIVVDWTVLQTRVAIVEPEGPAARAGIVPGDIIITVDRAHVEKLGPEAVYTLITARGPGAQVTIGVERDGTRFARTLMLVSFEP